MMKINFEKIGNIKVDCVISFGITCKVAENIKRNNLRFFSSPFDYVGYYTFDEAINLLQNHGKTFFSDYILDSNYDTETTFGLYDRKTGMVSKHDFQKILPQQMNHVLFRDKYRRRFNRLDKILQDAKNICLVSQRQTSTKELENFIEKFLQMYNFENLYYVNIYDYNDNTIDEKIIKTEKNNITILEYFFNDEHPNGRDKNKNPDYWIGNIDYWNKILSKISLNEDFVKKHVEHKKTNLSSENIK